MIDLYWWPMPNGWTVTTVAGVWSPLHDQAHQYRPRGPTVSGYSPAFAERSNAANDHTTADMICYPWASLWQGRSVDLGEFPNTQRWLAEVGERSAIKNICAWAENSERIWSQSSHTMLALLLPINKRLLAYTSRVRREQG